MQQALRNIWTDKDGLAQAMYTLRTQSFLVSEFDKTPMCKMMKDAALATERATNHTAVAKVLPVPCVSCIPSRQRNKAPIPDHVGAAVKNVTSVIHKLDMAHPHDKDDFYREYDFVDDTSGRVLDHKLAVGAMKLETEFFRKMKVYDEVPRASAAADGSKVISTRWVDINKGDQKSANYRARLVGRLHRFWKSSG